MNNSVKTFVTACSLSSAALLSATDVTCSFAKDAWNPDDWQLVRSPRWQEMSHWVQKEDHIANFMPDDIKPEDMQMGRDRTGETYISMLWKKPMTQSVKVTTVCVFDSRMAPLIVFSKELTPIHHEHIEVVLYDHGVNIWHHFFKDGKPSWKLIGFIDADLKIGEKHELAATLYFTKKGRFLLVECDGHSFGSRIADDWPETYYVGFTACEGQNRFYNFKIESPKMTPVWQERLSD